ncbi:AhpC-TSA-domain-containing protein [Dichomitus squalens]|uniref:thioredoxin-dependent peroxiredoxin n=1 Tax=Dichomitus squalens TaxID=114155 RepID=A0A4Q9MQF7_9APHY|nr:AhpC-TSA-domain-containing protein [Dichomitus squalens]
MAPRAKASTETVEPARRSSRISAQPKLEPVEKPAKKAAAPKTKKRTAHAEDDEGGEDAPAVKKVILQLISHFWGFLRGALGHIQENTALQPIDIGDVLPSYTLKNEKDEDVDVATLAAEKGVVVFLVPKADTPGCTQQACGFRDIYPDFTSSGFDVYCLSADKPAAQTKWQTKKNLPYPLLSDPKRMLITALGAGEGGKTKRSHFIFEKGGKLLDKKIPVKPADSPKLALEFVKSLSS